MIDIAHAKQEFEKYLDEYDREDEQIYLKIEHTYGVVKYAGEIAGRMECSGEDVELAELIGLLHDIGRFEQMYSIRITVNSIRNDGTTRKDPGNGGKPRKIKGFSELMKRGELRIDTFFEKRAHFSEQKEKLSTLSTKRAGKPHKQRVPGSFLNWNE